MIKAVMRGNSHVADSDLDIRKIRNERKKNIRNLFLLGHRMGEEVR